VTWLVWRQHRAEAFALMVLVAAIGAVLFTLGSPMHDLFPHGADQCATPPLDNACRLGISQLQDGYGFNTALLILLNLVPLGIGAFLGAPLLARELESGTWQLAWTQAVPRTRWLTAKLAALAALTIALGTAFSAILTWYREPLNLFGRFDITGFDVTGIAPAAHALFAFALAALAGALLRRSLPALATAIVVFVTLRITVATWLRPYYRSPITLTEEIVPGSQELRLTRVPQDWTLGEGFTDKAGNQLGDLGTATWEHKALDSGIDPATYLNGQGIHRWMTYHPAGRFWSFQLIEGAIFTGLALLVMGWLVWRLRRRAF